MRGLGGGRVPHWLVGAAVAAVLAGAFVFLLSGARSPFSGGFELRAVFADTNGIETSSQVRIAGIDVGEVTAVDPLKGRRGRPMAMVTMQIDDAGLPIHADAQLTIRPRLFLEGNYFVDLRPGSPAAPELDAPALIPVGQTASSVSLDDVFTTLQSDVRTDLRSFLDQFGKSLVAEGGAPGLRELYASAPGAFRSTAQVAAALRGSAPGDLSELVRNLSAITSTLAAERGRLAELLSNLRVVAGSFAVRSEDLSRAVATLPATLDAAHPALDALNGSLPATRAFAREALSGVRRLPAALDAGMPLLRQLRALVSRREGRGLVADLRPTVPRLARLATRSVPLLERSRELGSCFNEVVIPWANSTIEDPETPPEGRLFEEITYGLVGIAGESRSVDANGPYARVLGGSGTNIVTLPPTGGNDRLFGIAPLEILGARPSLQSSAKPPFRPDAACERQAPPDLDSGAPAPPPEQTPTGAPAGKLSPSPALRSRIEALGGQLERIQAAGGGGGRRATAVLEELNRLLADRLGWQALLEEDQP